MRYGMNECTVQGWQARFKIMAEFETTIGCSIYQILPGIVVGTFGFDPAKKQVPKSWL